VVSELWTYFVAYVHSHGYGSVTWESPGPITTPEQVAEIREWLDRTVAAEVSAFSERPAGPVVVTGWQLLSAPAECCPTCGTGNGVASA